MDARLVQLLGSFIDARSRYSLARLEFAMENGEAEVPPTIDRLPDASARSLHSAWPGIAAQIEAAAVFVKRLEAETGSTVRGEGPLRHLSATVREMDQYARAVQWVRTVTTDEEE